MSVCIVEEESCPCDLYRPGETFVCHIHGIEISSIGNTEQSCSWSICFDLHGDSADEHDVHGVSDEESEEEFHEDSFEIEFSSEICLYSEGDVTECEVSFSHTASFVFDSSTDDEDEDEDDDEDEDSCDSDTDDEQDDEEVTSSWSPTTQKKFLRNEMSSAAKKRLFSNCSDHSPRGKTLSKYHSFCSHSHSIVYNNNIDNRNDDVSNSENRKEKPKRVHFPTDPEKLVQVRRMFAWPYASKQSRKSNWMRAAQDRVHFQRKIDHKYEDLLSPVLKDKYAQFQAGNDAGTVLSRLRWDRF